MSKNLAAKYYPENKKDYKKTRERYQNLFKEEKEKKWQYGREYYKNLSYKKKVLWTEKKRFVIIIRKYFNLENFASL